MGAGASVYDDDDDRSTVMSPRYSMASPRDVQESEEAILRDLPLLLGRDVTILHAQQASEPICSLIMTQRASPGQTVTLVRVLRHMFNGRDAPRLVEQAFGHLLDHNAYEDGVLMAEIVHAMTSMKIETKQEMVNAVLHGTRPSVEAEVVMWSSAKDLGLSERQKDILGVRISTLMFKMRHDWVQSRQGFVVKVMEDLYNADPASLVRVVDVYGPTCVLLTLCALQLLTTSESCPVKSNQPQVERVTAVCVGHLQNQDVEERLRQSLEQVMKTYAQQCHSYWNRRPGQGEIAT